MCFWIDDELNSSKITKFPFLSGLTAAKNAISQADTDVKNSQMKIKHSQEEVKKRKSEVKKSSSDYDKDKANLDNLTKQISKIKVSLFYGSLWKLIATFHAYNNVTGEIADWVLSDI